LARGHLALGFVLNNGSLKPAEATPHYRAAQELAPGDADVLRSVAGFYGYGEDRALAMRMIDQVLELDPINARAFRSAGYIALFARDYSQVIDRMQKALALNPSLGSAHFGIAIARLMQGDAAGALTAAKAEQGEAYALTATAIAAHRLGDQAGSDAALAALTGKYPDSRYQIAEVHAQRGDKAAAIALLDKALTTLDSGFLWAPNDPLLDPLRDEPAFKDLLIRFGS
jgi:tetratricopeptide (TPR) repeat protein